MSAEFIGCFISMNCGDDGIYQGIVLNVDPIQKNIIIEKPVKYINFFTYLGLFIKFLEIIFFEK